MLVLTRKADEGVRLRMQMPDGSVRDLGRVMVDRVRGKAVALGFDLDRDVSVLRDEVIERDDRGGPRPLMAPGRLITVEDLETV